MTLKTILQKLPEHNRLLLLSLIVGACSGFAAVLLQKSIHFIQKALAPVLESSSSFDWKYCVVPAVGMLASYLILKYIVKDNISHGVTKVLLAVSRNESRIKAHNCISSVATSALTIGFGGSVGAEAPIVYTGAAIGSNIGRLTGLSHKSITVLVGCGAAGAVAGIFKAPLAGVLFTLEILLFNISLSSMMPLLISTVAATVVSYVCLGYNSFFTCELVPFSLDRLPFYLILGVIAGLVSLYFQNTTLWLESKLGKMKSSIWKWLLCATVLGLIISFFPPLYGEGYSTIDALLSGEKVSLQSSTPLGFLLGSDWGIIVFFALTMLLKVFSMTFTNAGGGVGGTFGPTLVVGGLMGFVMVRFCNQGFAMDLPEQNFVLVGMAGLMAGVMQAPMTAIFLIAEISGGYELLFPLIVCSTVSFCITRIWEKYSIYSKRIAQSGDLLTHDSDQSMLTLLKVSELVRDKYPKVLQDASLGELVDVIAENNAAVLAVLDGRGKYHGFIDIGNVRKYLLRREEYNTLKAKDLIEPIQDLVFEDDKMEDVMQRFDKNEAWRLPVISRDGRYLGFISRSRILTAYREKLKEFTSPD